MNRSASATNLLPLDPVSTPRGAPPPGATDCHAHVFGPFDVFGPFGRFPINGPSIGTKDEQPVSRYLRLLDEIGFSRGVLVAASAYGTDNGVMMDALRVSRGRVRGVAVISPEVTDSALIEMHEAGVRGARFALLPSEMLAKGTPSLAALQTLAPRLSDLGWHGQIVTTADMLIKSAPDLLKLRLPLVMDHMGLFQSEQGVQGAGFQNILRLLVDGRFWLKLTAYRLSSNYPGYSDLAVFHRALLNANPERVVWGSDWPHVMLTADMPDTGHLVDLLADWTASDELLAKVLVDNPSKLYGFDRQG